jgi:hypothetical protein
MSTELFETIEQQGLIRGGKVNLKRIEKLSTSDIVDFGIKTRELTSSKNLKREKSIYAFSTSSSISGGIHPCSSLGCRLDKAKNLAQFAALYGDRVYINYYPNEYLNHFEGIKNKNSSFLKERLVNDLSVLNYLRPLIENNKIIPITHSNYCPHCLAKESFGGDADKRLGKIFSDLKKRYNKEMIVELEKVGSKYILHATAPEDLLEHGSSNFIANQPFNNLDKFPSIMEELNAGRKVTLSRAELRKIGYDEYQSGIIRNNVAFELATTQTTNTNYLTDRNLDIDVLRGLSGDPEVDELNLLVQKYLTCLVPFVEDAIPSDLLKIRKNEEEAFLVFRQSLNQAITEYRKQGREFTERDAQAIYGDIIEPKLAQLNNKVKNAKKNLIKDTTYKILGWTGAISFGLYAGLLPADLATAATALGLVKIMADITEGALAKSTIDANIRDESLYFLWKVQKKVK